MEIEKTMKRRFSYISLCRFFFSFIIAIAQWQVLLTYRINLSETTISKPHEYDGHSLFVQRVLAPGRKRVDDWTESHNLVRERESLVQKTTTARKTFRNSLQFDETKAKCRLLQPKSIFQNVEILFFLYSLASPLLYVHDLRCVGGGGYCDIFIIILNIMIYTTFRKEVFLEDDIFTRDRVESLWFCTFHRVHQRIESLQSAV